MLWWTCQMYRAYIALPIYAYWNFPLFCLFCCFTSQVNSYGHCGTVSSPNHTFSWAGLNKPLTSNSCTCFRLYLTTILLEWISGREENDRRNHFMINLHESMGPDRDRTRDPWICSQTRICSPGHVTDCATPPGIFPLLSTGPVHFYFKGCWMVFFHFSQILIEQSVNTQWWPWSDATFCGVWSGSALFACVT